MILAAGCRDERANVPVEQPDDTFRAGESDGPAGSPVGNQDPIAGHFDVPIIMISGDDATIKEVTGIVGDMEGAVVKEAISFHSAKTLTPGAARILIHDKAKAGTAAAK